jgi:hypothetical protein
MARITVVKGDGLIMVNKEGYHGIDLSFLEPNIHAIQWYDTWGEIERKDERNRHLPNEEITSLGALEGFIMAAWQAKKEEVALAQQAQLEALAAKSE